MYYEEESRVTEFMTGVLVGAVLGVGIAFLAAPQRGKGMRARLVRGSTRPGPAGEADGEMSRDEIMTALKRRRRKARP